MSAALERISQRQRNIPVDVVQVANDLGMMVYSVPNWSNDLSGMIKKRPDGSGIFDIYVNASHGYNRQRFTIAHEIAHAVLHPELIGDGITDDALLRSGLSNSVEAQANRLAADILMPRQKIDEEVNGGSTEVSDLARKFQVSEQAMAIRLGVPQ